MQDKYFYGNAFLFGILGALVISAIIGCILPSMEIGTVNITGLVDKFIKNEINKNLSPVELKKEVNTFGQSLDNAINKFAHANNLILFPREAVISGAKDYTQDIEMQMKQRNRESNES